MKVNFKEIRKYILSGAGCGITVVDGSLGSFGYSFFWLFAALKALELSSTGAAKEALFFMAIPSVGYRSRP